MLLRMLTRLLLCVGLMVSPSFMMAASSGSSDNDAVYDLDHRLLQAVARGDSKMVKKLLQDGASVNAQDGQGHTALIFATVRGFTELVTLLLDKGAAVDAADHDGNTALVYAAKYGFMPIVELLIKRGANINHSNNFRDTALKWAAYKGSMAIAKILLVAGADPNSSDIDGNTALFDAVARGHASLVELLIQYKADVALKNNQGFSVLDMAKRYRYPHIVKLLRKHIGQEEDDLDEDDSEDGPQKLLERVKKLPISLEQKKELWRVIKQAQQESPFGGSDKGSLKEYIDTVFNLPWGVYTKDNLSIVNAKKTLDDDHFGMEEVKEKILDYIAALALKKDGKAPILCLVGPPGVGKTSLGKSIAQALGRKYGRIAVGGLYDESELRGHRRTYVGARPGRFIQMYKQVRSGNPLILIDEIDKVGRSSHHGDPYAALLEILDPEQNHEFRDNYLEIPFDLSKTLFITTANDVASIPAPLRDRMEIIELSSYSDDEKVAIVRNHLLKNAVHEAGLDGKIKNIADIMSPDILGRIIRNYAKGSGIRTIKRFLATLMAKKAREFVEKGKISPIQVADLAKYLGTDRLALMQEMHHEHGVGLINGLAYTGSGSGTLLKIEMMLVPRLDKEAYTLVERGHGLFKESLGTAFHYVLKHAARFGIPIERFKEKSVYINIADKQFSPVDGPSAGMAQIVGFVSVFTDRAVNAQYAMTGAVDSRGHVLPIGGVKEKLQAAKDNGMKFILFPEDNRQDVDKLDKVLKEGIKIILVKHVDEALNLVLM